MEKLKFFIKDPPKKAIRITYYNSSAILLIKCPQQIRKYIVDTSLEFKYSLAKYSYRMLVAIHKRRQQNRGGRGQELAKIANSSRVIWSDLSISSELLDLFHLLLFSEFTWRSWLSYFSELASYCLSNVSGFLFTQNIGIRLLYNFGTHPKRPP